MDGGYTGDMSLFFIRTDSGAPRTQLRRRKSAFFLSIQRSLSSLTATQQQEKQSGQHPRRYRRLIRAPRLPWRLHRITSRDGLVHELRILATDVCLGWLLCEKIVEEMEAWSARKRSGISRDVPFLGAEFWKTSDKVCCGLETLTGDTQRQCMLWQCRIALNDDHSTSSIVSGIPRNAILHNPAFDRLQLQ
jgi:hypothetical protein